MDDLQKMLQSRQPKEPPQVVALKKYAKTHHGVDIAVRVSKKSYLITVPGASLAHIFRVETAKIVESCNLDKRLVIHIGY